MATLDWSTLAQIRACCLRVSLLGYLSWWRHQMEKFSALLAFCAGNSPVTGKFPTQRPVTRSFNVCFDLHLNKRLIKQLWGWWFKMPSCSLWRHRNVFRDVNISMYISTNKQFIATLINQWCYKWNLGKQACCLMSVGYENVRYLSEGNIYEEINIHVIHPVAPSLTHWPLWDFNKIL